MPSPRLRTRRRRDRITVEHWLALGRYPSFGEPWHVELRRAPKPLDYVEAILADMRRVWGMIGKNLTAHWIRHNPGTRPWAWWMFDAPEKHRRILSGAEYEILQSKPESTEEEAVKRMAIDFGLCGVLSVRDMTGPRIVCESEYAYLKRLDLLTAAEKRIPESKFPATTEEEDSTFRDDESWLPQNLC